MLLDRSKDTIALYNVSTGVRFAKRKLKLDGLEELVLTKEPAKVLPLLERALTTEDKLAVILEYADTIAPAGDTSFSTIDDRAAAVTLHRWSLLRALEQSDSIVVLSLENLSELHPKIVSNPRVATVRVPMPSKEERAALLRFLDPALGDDDVEQLAEVTAGLKSVQIKGDPRAARCRRRRRRRAQGNICSSCSSGGKPPTKDVHERADKLAQITQGMTREAIRKLIAPDGKPPAPSTDARAEIDKLVAARKREIIERECFGLIEFVTPQYGFEVVGGMEEVKKELLLVAKNIREGKRNRVPMGILFTGPMGTGKTFVAEAFAKECGLTTIKLKNFRTKWVGATEGNLERILSVIQAIGQIIVIIDEGDRAFGGSDGDGDGGTSSRVIGRIKEFMSDTENRGRVLFILMTNRPDKLDVDIKRAGRLDRKIPFLYPQTGDEVVNILKAQFKKNKVKAEIDFDARENAGRIDRRLFQRRHRGDRDAGQRLLRRRDPSATARRSCSARRRTICRRATCRCWNTWSCWRCSKLRIGACCRRSTPTCPVDELQARLQLLKAQVGSRR